MDKRFHAYGFELVDGRYSVSERCRKIEALAKMGQEGKADAYKAIWLYGIEKNKEKSIIYYAKNKIAEIPISGNPVAAARLTFDMCLHDAFVTPLSKQKILKVDQFKLRQSKMLMPVEQTLLTCHVSVFSCMQEASAKVKTLFARESKEAYYSAVDCLQQKAILNKKHGIYTLMVHSAVKAIRENNYEDLCRAGDIALKDHEGACRDFYAHLSDIVLSEVICGTRKCTEEEYNDMSRDERVALFRQIKYRA